MNFQHLRHFVITADTGNMLKAADTLNISQSGLSRSIGALEAMLGLPLFERSAKGVELTAFGERFYPHARLMMNEYNRSIDALKVFQNLKGGSIRLGINNSFAYYLIPDVTAELVRRWPDVHIDIASDNYAALVEALARGDLDIAFSLYTETSRREDLDYENLFEIRMRVFARADHPIRATGTIEPADLAKWQWGLINGASAQAAFTAHFEAAGLVAPNIAVQTSSVALLATVVAKSDLLTILPEELVHGARGFAIAPLGVDWSFGVAKVALIRRRGSFDSPIADRFARLMRARAETMAPPIDFS